MKFINRITPLIISRTVSGAVALSLLFVGLESYNARAAVVRLAQALSPEEVNLRAKQIIVRIDGASVGSGSIIDRSNNEYTVLSNWHVMKDRGDFVVQTIDGRKHQVISNSIKKLPGLDLAVFKFETNQNYQTAELGDSSNLSEGQNVYFAGYPGELRREDNRYYRFFTANLVGILPKSTENGYSLVYNGEAFPGMSGGPVFNRDGLMIGVHGEANVAFTGGTSNYAVPINAYQQAIAELDAQPTAAAPSTSVPDTEPEQPAVEDQFEEPEAEVEQLDSESTVPEVVDSQEPKSEESLDSDSISSVPTFAPATASETNQDTAQPETEDSAKQEEPAPASTESNAADQQSENAAAETEDSAKQEEPAPASTESNAADQQPEDAAPETEELEEVEVLTTTRKISLVSPETGIDYSELRNLLRDKKWSEADIYTYKLIEQVVESAKQQNKHVFIELKTIAEYSCSDLRTVDYLWKKYSGDKFGFSPQQKIWQNVNQKGDFSTQTWRRFATEVGWKKGEVASGNGYLLYDQLDFEPEKAPAGHLPWWFALPDESQKVIKYLFSRCNLNPSEQELAAEARKNSPDSDRNPEENDSSGENNYQNGNQPNINKPPKSPDK